MKGTTIIFLVAAVAIVLLYWYFCSTVAKQQTVTITGPAGTQKVVITTPAINSNLQLKPGTTGPEVEVLQVWLNQLGANLTTSGTFDSNTVSAIENIMVKWGLTWNGGISLNQFEQYATTANQSVMYTTTGGTAFENGGQNGIFGLPWVNQMGAQTQIFFSSN